MSSLFQNPFLANEKPITEKLIDKSQVLRFSGRQSWIMLHTYAAFLPDKLNNEEKQTFSDFFYSIIHFSNKNQEWISNTNKVLNESSLDFSTRDSARLSICHFHNKINWNIGKDQYPCTIKDLSQLYGEV